MEVVYECYIKLLVHGLNANIIHVVKRGGNVESWILMSRSNAGFTQQQLLFCLIISSLGQLFQIPFFWAIQETRYRNESVFSCTPKLV